MREIRGRYRFLYNPSFLFPARLSHIRLKSLREPVTNRKEDVEAARVAGMMQHVVPRRRAEPPRQPAAHMRAPVNFFKRDVVNRETRKHSRRPAIAENPL